jgi:DNA mismatch repair protein MutS2
MENEIEVLEEKLRAETYSELEFEAVLELITRYCLTPRGKELILQPDFASMECLNQELQAVQEAKECILTAESLPLERVEANIDAIKRAKVDGAVLDVSELSNIASMVSLAGALKGFIRPKKDKYPLLKSEIEALYYSNELQKRFDAVVDSNGGIKDSASRELQSIRGDLRNKVQSLHSKMTRLAREVGALESLNEDFYTIKGDRFVLPVRAKDKNRHQGVIHGASASGLTLYLEPLEAVEWNNELELLKNREQIEINNILKSLNRVVASNYVSLLDLYESLGHIDAVQAKAQYAVKSGGILPIVNDEHILTLKGVRHPLLVHKLGIKGVVPLNIGFNKCNRGHLISGPNAGGKTIAMKTVGLSILMALNGIFPLG